MIIAYGTPADIDPWMKLVERTRQNFPGLETQEALDAHRTAVLKFMSKKQAVCVKEENEIIGVILFSRSRNMICYLAVSPDFRRRGVASMLMDEALDCLDRTREITVSTFLESDEKGLAPRALYRKYGFIEGAITLEFNYPNQIFTLYPDGAEQKSRHLAVNRMTGRITGILSANKPSVYLYGSSVYDDFRPGWSDIDILVLTEQKIDEDQANKLVSLRQTMLFEEPGNPFYRSFEGGMLTLKAFLEGTSDRVVYWGTSGERITDRYSFDSFCMTELISKGALLSGKDIRDQLKMPLYADLYADVKRHFETIRKYAHTTGRSLYTFGWLLDICRCIRTLRTGEIVSKTAAAEWALENGLCPDPDALEFALKVRKDPLQYRNDSRTFDIAENLNGPVSRFTGILEKELLKAASRL